MKNVLISNTRKKYTSSAMTIAIFSSLFFLIIGMKEICRGIILGSFFSVLNLILISESIKLRLEKAKKKMTRVVIKNILIRYSGMSIPIIVAIKSSRFNLIGTVIGLFTVQIAILWDHFSSG